MERHRASMWDLPIRALVGLFGAALTRSHAGAREFTSQVGDDFAGTGTARNQSDALMLYTLFYGMISSVFLLVGIGLAALADSRHNRPLADGIVDFVTIPQLLIWWVPILYFQLNRIRLRRSAEVLPPPGWQLLGVAVALAVTLAALLHLAR